MEPGGVMAMIIALASAGAVVLVDWTRPHPAGIRLDRDLRRHRGPMPWQELR